MRPVIVTASGDPGQPIAFQWPGFIPVGTEIEVRIAAGKSTVEISPAEVDRQVVFPD